MGSNVHFNDYTDTCIIYRTNKRTAATGCSESDTLSVATKSHHFFSANVFPLLLINRNLPTPDLESEYLRQYSCNFPRHFKTFLFQTHGILFSNSKQCLWWLSPQNNSITQNACYICLMYMRCHIWSNIVFNPLKTS